MVQCTAFSRNAVRPLKYFIVQFALHLPEQGEEAKRLVAKSDPDSVDHASRKLSLASGQTVRIKLDVEGAEVTDNFDEITWNGEIEIVDFDVRAPAAGFGEMRAKAELTVDGAPVRKCSWIIKETESSSEEGVPIPFVRYQRAFFSYASEDRSSVLEHAKTFRSMKVDFFLDLLTLEPGDRFENVIEDEITKCDLFVLFWSSSARASKWVIREATRALEVQGGNLDGKPDFSVILLEGPPPPKPPPVLRSSVHFNDYLQYVSAANKAATAESKRPD